MQIRELAIPDSYELTPAQFQDDRGLFLEWYRFEVLEQAIGHALDLRQANLSVSRRGVLRGIHSAAIPGQAKLVTAMAGAVLDFVVDIRVGSPTFGSCKSVVLDPEQRRAVFVAEGVGHGFVVLSETASLAYKCTAAYSADDELAVRWDDPALGIDWRIAAPVLSDKDAAAPTLAEIAPERLPPYEPRAAR